MDFSLTDDQQLLRDTATKLLERECPPSVVRAHIDDPSVYEPLWRHLREFTALGAGPATDLCLFLEQTGYVGRARTVPRDCAVHGARRRRRRDDGHRRFSRRPDEPVRARSRPRREDRDRRAGCVHGRRRYRSPGRPAALRLHHRLLPARLLPRHPPTSTSTAAPIDADAFAGVARPGARVDRGRDDRHRPPHLRHVTRLRQGARAVRPADRIVPGHPAQARRHVARAPARDRRGAVRAP